MTIIVNIVMETHYTKLGYETYFAKCILYVYIYTYMYISRRALKISMKC